MSVRVYVRSPVRTRIGELDDWQALSVTTRHTGGGVWSITASTKATLASLFGPGTGIIVERDGEVVMSGPVASIKRTKDSEKDTLTIAGYEDSVWLARRWVQPCPPNYTTSPHVYTAAPYDVFVGPCESVMKHYVTYALSGAASEFRQLRGLVITENQERGKVIRQQGRFDKLDELLTSTALQGGDLGYAIRQESADDARLYFDVVEPRDLTGVIRFSTDLGNIASFEYEQAAPEMNAVLVAAGGELTDRLTLEMTDEDSVALWGRIEGPMRDRRDTEDVVQMEQTVDEELDKGAQKLAVALEVSDTEFMKFGHHWGVHDRVAVDIEGVVFNDIVREATVSWSNDAPEKVTAVIGTPEATAPNVLKLFANQRQNAARTARLERAA